MSNDYLWDGSGTPDPEIQKLEAALSKFRHSAPVPSFVPASIHRKSNSQSLPSWTHRLAAAAILAIALTGAGLALRQPATPPLPRVSWEVTHLQGSSLVGQAVVRSEKSEASLEVGQSLVTSRDSRASISVADVGQIDLEPNTHVRLIESAAGRKRIALERGTIHAVIWAPPGEFVVDTPSAVAVDLGCAYTLQVDENGDGTIRTVLGWVGFQRDRLESFIPAGAICPTWAKSGPGTPYFEDASQQFQNALAAVDFGNASVESREAQLKILLAQARPRDAISLWHLLSRMKESDRQLIYERLAKLVPPPKSVTREGILQLDPGMLDSWWNEFQLGDISVWRYWKQNWNQKSSGH